jgi:hypothetical protein
MSENKDKKEKRRLITAPELLIIIGFLMIAAGLYLVYMPAALVICGAMLMYAGWPKGVKQDNGDNQ